MIKLPPIPMRMVDLPRDERGYPVPWFVAWKDGAPEFRCTEQEKIIQAVRDRLCWVCGKPHDRLATYVIGPMCAVNRTSAEPPSHRLCAEFSAVACPFLSRPKAKRREAGMPPPEERAEVPGIALMRNPGVTLLWTCDKITIFPVGNGFLFELADPKSVQFYAEGRLATRAEIMESIETGLPALQKIAAQEGRKALQALARAVNRAMRLLPKEAA